MRDKIKKILHRLEKTYSRKSITLVISVSFTLVAVLCTGISNVVLSNYFKERFERENEETAKKVIVQINNNIETYVKNMMRISDAMYYSVIKDMDISVDNMDKQLNVIYEANKDSLVSIACYLDDGRLIAATPVETVKETVDVREQSWFTSAMNKAENFHFSKPHVQNLFDYSSYRYYWVVSLSRAVTLNNGGQNEKGVLVVDMNYSGIEQLLRRLNSNGSEEYIYLIDGEGNIIYHPKHKQINANLLEENNITAVKYDDGSHYETFGNQERIVTVKTVGYTGWKLVYVTDRKISQMVITQISWFVVLIILSTTLLLIVVNRFVTSKVTKPIEALEVSVGELEKGNLDVDIYIGGTYEVEHLGQTLTAVVNRLKELMDDIVIEQEAKRKSELDALQSQINPHFLYNTLDSIVWMIESERYNDAIFMITELASLFRISLSKGKNIISIEDELKHARNYMNIQMIRFKNKFSVVYEIQDSIQGYSTVKLILQPIIENAIYYGMEYMEGDGIITISGYEDNGNIYLHVIDNGPGMSKEEVDLLLTNSVKARKRGSGVGLLNVHQRIVLRYGDKYGIKVTSEPDEGTDVCICLPKILYNPDLGKDGAKDVK